jgi:hypothetical protein
MTDLVPVAELFLEVDRFYATATQAAALKDRGDLDGFERGMEAARQQFMEWCAERHLPIDFQ